MPLTIRERSLKSIKPYVRNPRKNDSAVEAVANSIREFGFRQPIVVDEQGVIIVGHTRYKAAQQLGMDKVPVHVASDLSEAQKQAYRIADNATASIAEWDESLLPVELGDLKALNFDLSLLGFTDAELNKFMSGGPTEGLTDPDLVPEPPEAAITQPGDLWLLGNHRLLCGDTALAADVDRLMDGQPAHMANCDPPYNVKVEPRSNNAIAAGNTTFFAPTKKSKRARTHHQQFDVERHPEKATPTTRRMRAKDRPLTNDFLPEQEFEQLLNAWFGNIARVLLPGRALYCWGGYSNVGSFPAALAANGLYFSQAVIWVKEHPVLTRKDFMGNHEWCFYSWKEGAAHEFFGPNNATDVWSIKKVTPTAMVHTTEKPVELAARAIEYSSRAGENVIDFFGGSGSTLIACEQHQRRAFLMEIDPPYCDVIVTRWEQFTGKKAVHGVTGEPFRTTPAVSEEECQ